MKQNRSYFIEYPNIFSVVGVMLILVLFIFSLSSVNRILIGIPIVLIVPGLDPRIKGYNSRVTLRYIGLLFFRNKTLYFKDIEHVHLKYISGKGSRYLFSILINNKTHKVAIRSKENALILLHLLKKNTVRIYSKRTDIIAKELYQLMENERKVETFDLDSRPYDRKDMFIEIGLTIIFLIYFGYFFEIL